MFDLGWPGTKLLASKDLPGIASAKEANKPFKILPDLGLLHAKLDTLSNHIASKLRTKFPGTQPVSFQRKDLDLVCLPGQFYVCEKSDGQRYLMMYINKQCLLVNTKLEFFELGEREERFDLVEDTLVDGELVLENDGKVNFYVFDSLHFSKLCVVDAMLDTRLRMIQSRNLSTMCPSTISSLVLKKMYLASASQFVLEQHLSHESDGLIFTKVSPPYVAGSSNDILKWKPVEMNTADFQVRKVQLENGSSKFAQLFWQERGVCKPFPHQSYIYLSKEQHELFEQVGKEEIVCECSFDADWFVPELLGADNWDEVQAVKPPAPAVGAWKFMRFRHDKALPNSIHTVESVMESIANPVTKHELLAKLLETTPSNDHKRVKLE
ncbi:hypothetical protein BASA81_000406 [Batrachochytrium salamandrivorans]|nr:hypothetical protein BASA81_000406 [Batrachochytrium salamandrivorans]